MTDLELINAYIATPHVNPALFADIRRRGLYNIINFLPFDKKEAKAVAYARLAEKGKYIGNEEIQEIADKIDRIKSLKQDLEKTKESEVDKLLPILAEMKTLSEQVLDYYKS